MVVTPDSESLIKKTIKELADELDPTMFWQVHRSTIVNVYAIDSVIRDERGNMTLRLKQRRESLPVSEAYTSLVPTDVKRTFDLRKRDNHDNRGVAAIHDVTQASRSLALLAVARERARRGR